MLFIEKKLIHMCRKYMDVFLRNGVIKPKCKFKKYNRRSVKKSQWPYWQTINFCSCLNLILHLILLSVQFSCSVVSDSLWPMNRSTPGIPVHHQLPEFTQLMSIKSVMPSSHLILCRSLLLLPSIPPSIRVFSNETTLRIMWQKYWSFSFSISPSKEHPGLISFRINWFDLLAVQGILKSLLQHPSSKASILRCSAFFIVQLSHPYMITGKTIALTRWILLAK